MTDEQFDARFGSPDHWQAFAKRNALFLDRRDNLLGAMNAAFNRTWKRTAPIDQVVFTSGSIVADDFMEILLLCANAEAHGAQKVIRGMFERVVTMTYLHLHPDETAAYVDYYWISMHKLVIQIETTFKKGLLDADDVKEVEENYEKLKGSYKDKLSWTSKDIITMAKEVDMSTFVVPAYYLPLQQAHPNAKGMLDRLTETPEGHIALAERQQPSDADSVFLAAHGLVLQALDVQVEHFKLDPAPFKKAKEDFVEIWKRP